MGGTLSIDWDNVESLLGSMVEVGLQSKELDGYFNEHVVNTVGLDYASCALKPIGDQLPKLGEAFSDMRRYYQGRWVEVIAAVAESADDLNRVDHGIDLDFKKYDGTLDAMPDTTISVRMFEPQELVLDAPEEGTAQLKHNQAWEVTSEGYDSTRDTINQGIDWINSLHAPGVHLPRLPEKSLEDYIVYPLAGNYELLGANGDACSKSSEQFTQWALNFGRLAAKTPACMTGDTATGFIAHLGLYGVVMEAVGQGIGQGAKVFSAISLMSEKIAVAVENALVKMATKLTKLATKLSSKLSPLGWLLFAKEVLEKGFDAVKDIYDDIMDCKAIIEACFGLVDTITAWAETMRDSLAAMKKIRDMVEQLPHITKDGGLGGLPPVHLPAVKKSLGEIEVEVSPTGSEQDDLEDKLDELQAQSEDDDEGSDIDDYDDEDGVLMAPGPLGQPWETGSSTGTMA